MTRELTKQPPLIRWAGSKRQLLPTLSRAFSNDAARYIEPFVGSAALFFHLAPHSAVLADVNEELITTYRTIVEWPERVYEEATMHGPSRARFDSLRAVDSRQLSPIARAARFLYLNRYCFNGLYRTNRQGRFNVPYAPARSGSFPDWDEFRLAALALGKAALDVGDFAQVLERHLQPGDFVYLDPPYAVANRRIFRQYGPETFGLEDLERLADVLHVIDAVGATFLVSYADCMESRKLFAHWHVRRVMVQRNISGFAKHRRRATEVLVSNAVERMPLLRSPSRTASGR